MDGLDGIRAKLDRAEEHLNVLDDAIGAYLREDPYRFAIEEHTDAEYFRWAMFLEVDRFPPDEIWGPLIGDAVHNLRSALDHLAWQLALPAERAANPRRIEFPIFLDDPANDPEVRGTITKKINRLRPETRALIYGAQPYKAGNSHHPLWLLQSLWNTDKHRVLHTAGFLFGRRSDDASAIEHGFGYEGWSHGPFGRLGDAENRTPLSRGYISLSQGEEIFRLNIQNQVDTYKDMTFDVSLGQIGDGVPTADEPYAGLPIRQVLRRIQRHIEADVLAPLALLL